MTQEEFFKRYTYTPSRDRIGGGGFGTVYKAKDNVLHREVGLSFPDLGWLFYVVNRWLELTLLVINTDIGWLFFFIPDIGLLTKGYPCPFFRICNSEALRRGFAIPNDDRRDVTMCGVSTCFYACRGVAVVKTSLVP